MTPREKRDIEKIGRDPAWQHDADLIGRSGEQQQSNPAVSPTPTIEDVQQSGGPQCSAVANAY